MTYDLVGGQRECIHEHASVTTSRILEVFLNKRLALSTWNGHAKGLDAYCLNILILFVIPNNSAVIRGPSRVALKQTLSDRQQGKGRQLVDQQQVISSCSPRSCCCCRSFPPGPWRARYANVAALTLVNFGKYNFLSQRAQFCRNLQSLLHNSKR